MSASEKLRALDVRIAEADAAALLSGAGAILDAYKSLALPQIVAVVEAAENLALRIEEEQQNERTYRLDDALAALNKALALGSSA